MSNPPTEFIGQTFEDQLVLILPGQEYIGCKFLRCDVHFTSASAKLYDCEFDRCTLNFPDDFPTHLVPKI